jgi:hypothetical protein
VSPLFNHPQYPIGAVYRFRQGGEVKVEEWGYLSIRLSGAMNTWVGVQEMHDWLRRNEMKKTAPND